MTSQCGSDSPDGAAVVSSIEAAIFTIFTSAGEARASLYQALDKARAGEMAESEQCMIGADTQLKKAHDVQTELIARDLNGSLPMSLLLVDDDDVRTVSH